eukprot:119056_1
MNNQYMSELYVKYDIRKAIYYISRTTLNTTNDPTVDQQLFNPTNISTRIATEIPTYNIQYSIFTCQQYFLLFCGYNNEKYTHGPQTSNNNSLQLINLYWNQKSQRRVNIRFCV